MGGWRFARTDFLSRSGTMADDDGPTFETTESGSSHTYPQQAGEIRKGAHLMIKGRPCKCVEESTSKTGKHGHAKAHIVALDIFTNKKYEDLCPTSHNLDVPFVKRVEYQVLSADADEGTVSMLKDPNSGETKDDLNLPTIVTTGEPTDDDKKVSEELLKGLDDGKTVIAIVQSACGVEKIIQVKVNDT